MKCKSFFFILFSDFQGISMGCLATIQYFCTLFETPAFGLRISFTSADVFVIHAIFCWPGGGHHKVETREWRKWPHSARTELKVSGWLSWWNRTVCFIFMFFNKYVFKLGSNAYQIYFNPLDLVGRDKSSFRFSEKAYLDFFLFFFYFILQSLAFVLEMFPTFPRRAGKYKKYKMFTIKPRITNIVT